MIGCQIERKQMRGMQRSLVALLVLASVAFAGGCKEKGVSGKDGDPTLTLDLGGGVKLDLVLIPAGSFTMGSPESEPPGFHSDTEEPLHKVTIAKPFYMGKYEITREQFKLLQWDATEFKNPSEYPDIAGNMRIPTDSVAWIDCKKWCDEASKRTGRTVRLATEAEWEYACRAGTQTAFCCGDTLSPEYGQFDSSGVPGGKKPKHTAQVGSFKPNAWGLYDMHGNVGEWVEDNYHENYQGAPSDGSAWYNPQNKNLRVHRGGAYLNREVTCRSAMRCAGGSDTDPELRTQTIGFRVVVEMKK